MTLDTGPEEDTGAGQHQEQLLYLEDLLSGFAAPRVRDVFGGGWRGPAAAP